MKILIAFAFCFLPFTFFGQEDVSFYFENNKSALNQLELTKLNKWISVNKKSKILSITGSTDEVGSSGYNDTLSQKRVDYIFNEVKVSVKIREDFKLISLGEKGAKSKTKAENRKATIVFLQEKDLAKEELLFFKTDEITTEIDPQNNLNDMILNSKSGDIIKLKNIEFYLGSDVLIEKSYKELNDLYEILNQSEALKIEIQGHVCCNSNPKDKKSIRLSLKRAKKINDFLIKLGINENRLRYSGFGSSIPIYKIPEESLDQQQTNRRVEILIVDK
jgi:outer membrane protein OmpA-like peptidoglycan-associated protein